MQRDCSCAYSTHLYTRPDSREAYPFTHHRSSTRDPSSYSQAHSCSHYCTSPRHHTCTHHNHP